MKWLALVSALAFAGCGSTPKSGRLNARIREFAPAPEARACTADTDCVPVSADCRSACSGGASVNRASLDAFLKAKSKACPSVSASNKRFTATCVAAPVVCRAKLCTWSYEGPDPSTL